MTDNKLILGLSIYGLIVTVALVWVSVSYSKHTCPEPVTPEITKENYEKIKEIATADSDDADSLLVELFGFEPVK